MPRKGIETLEGRTATDAARIISEAFGIEVSEETLWQRGGRSVVKHLKRRVELDMLEREQRLLELEADERNFIVTKLKQRPLFQLKKDKVLPSHIYDRYKNTRRMEALIHVLGHLPEMDYRTLVDLADTVDFYFYLPPSRVFGSARSLPRDVVYIYLSHELEGMRTEQIQYVAAHELGHVISRHIFLQDSSSSTKEVRERQADKLAEAWGYKKHFARGV